MLFYILLAKSTNELTATFSLWLYLCRLKLAGDGDNRWNVRYSIAKERHAIKTTYEQFFHPNGPATT